MEVYLKAQNQILADLRARVRDNNSERWTDAEMYGAINDALLSWQDRVRVPHLYTISGGWVSGTLEYTLPDWIRSNSIQPQMKSPTQFDSLSSAYRLSTNTWQDIPGWRIEPNATNGRVLKFNVSPYSTEGRIIWWGSNGPLPISVGTLVSQLESDAESLTIDDELDCGTSGYIRIDQEWMQFAGSGINGSTLLNNLVRGLSGGAEATVHDIATSVYFGVAMPKMELYRVLIDQCIVHLNELFLGNASSKEKQTHQELIGFYEGRVKEFWRNWSDTKVVKTQVDISAWINL